MHKLLAPVNTYSDDLFIYWPTGWFPERPVVYATYFLFSVLVFVSFWLRVVKKQLRSTLICRALTCKTKVKAPDEEHRDLAIDVLMGHARAGAYHGLQIRYIFLVDG